MTHTPRVELRAPAKINPRLEIVGRRADGQHEVRTCLLALDLFDELTLSLLPSGRLEVELSGPAATPDVPRDERNLAVRAARLVLRLAAAGAEPGLGLQVHKRIPSRAGLGGGSSDAAAAALGACRLLDVDPDDAELGRELGRLGADVPFFLHARDTGWARARGRGELVEALPAPATERAFVLLTPRATCATAAVYAALEPREWRAEDATDEPPEGWLAQDLGAARRALANDLEPPALRSHAELADVRRALDRGGGAHFRLSGSGSSFFGLFADREAAEAFLASEATARISRDHGLRVRCVAAPAGHGAAF